jgi:AraC family transcriptional regulator
MSEFVIKELKEMKVASVSHVGPYWELTEAFETLVSKLQENSITPKSAPMGLYYDNPKDVAMDQLKSEAVIEIDPGVESATGLVVKTLLKAKVISCIYKGPYGDVGKYKIYEKIKTYTEQNSIVIDDALPLREVYLNNPGEVDTKDLETEIMFPIK